MYETYQQNEREFEEKFKCIKSDCDGNGCIPHQVAEDEWEAQQCQFHAEYLFPMKSHNRLSLIKVMKALEKELVYKECPHDSHSHCMKEECYLNEDTGYNAGIRASLDKIREFISKLEKKV